MLRTPAVRRHAMSTAPSNTVHAVISSPVGELTLVGHDDTLTALYFPEHVRRPGQESFGPRDDAAFPQAAGQRLGRLARLVRPPLRCEHTH